MTHQKTNEMTRNPRKIPPLIRQNNYGINPGKIVWTSNLPYDCFQQ